MPLRKRFSAPIVSWPASIIPISTKPQAPRTNLKRSVRHTKSSKTPTNAPNMTAMALPGRVARRGGGPPRQAMKTFGSALVVQKILPSREVAGSVVFLNRSLALQLGGAQLRDDAVLVDLRTEHSGLCLGQTGKHA